MPNPQSEGIAQQIVMLLHFARPAERTLSVCLSAQGEGRKDRTHGDTSPSDSDTHHEWAGRCGGHLGFRSVFPAEHREFDSGHRHPRKSRHGRDICGWDNGSCSSCTCSERMVVFPKRPRSTGHLPQIRLSPDLEFFQLGRGDHLADTMRPMRIGAKQMP
jgi:hypothetical protein